MNDAGPERPPSRGDALRRLSTEVFDVLVIGGGIVGSGIARDAAMRGLRTGLVDRHDFAFGTSSRSSRLLHGGLRYLEQGRIGLVRESSIEKKIVQHIAPHLAQPLGFVFPSYRGRGRPLWQLRAGVKAYDLLCGGRNFERSRTLDRNATLAALPGLDARELRGSVRYFDALTNDARLVIDTIRSAARHGATVANYAAFKGADRDSAKSWRCGVADQRSGSSFTVRARVVVNATGPWSESIPRSSIHLRLTKGAHIVVNRTRLPVVDAAVVAEGARILFVLPWGERTIVGTTDTDYAGAPEDVSVEREDVAYLLRTVNGAFPASGLGTDDIIASWAGLRPLIASGKGSPSDISRAHEIHSPEAGWWDVAGGKLTTYRLIAEQTVDRIVRHLRREAPPCGTADEPLLQVGSQLSAAETPSVPAPLLSPGPAVGAGGPSASGPPRAGSGLAAPPFSGILPAPFTRDAVEHYVRNEWALTVDDILVRRSGWQTYHPDNEARTSTVAAWLGELGTRE